MVHWSCTLVFFPFWFSGDNFCTLEADAISRPKNKGIFADFSVCQARPALILMHHLRKESFLYLLTLKFPGSVIVRKHCCSLWCIYSSRKILSVICDYVFWSLCVVTDICMYLMHMFMTLFLSARLPLPLASEQISIKTQPFYFDHQVISCICKWIL